MSESILKALMQLFAIIGNVNKDDDSNKARSIVEAYLKQLLNQELVLEYLAFYDQFSELHHRKSDKKRTSANSVKVLMICEQINEELQQNQKMLVLLQLIEFVSYGEVTEKELEFIKTVADTFNISETEYLNCKSFILDSLNDIAEKNKVLIIDAKQKEKNLEYKHIFSENLTGEIHILHISSTNMYVFRYLGSDNLSLNGHNIKPEWGYLLVKGSSIRSSKINPIYYSDIANQFLLSKTSSHIVFTAKDIEFKFKNSDNGIHAFNFSEESGQLIGIMGGSGVGKSTLLNVLNGNLKLTAGQILINGLDIYADKDKLEGVVGFIPQDDLLIEELTVYQNLYYNAKLCFNDMADAEMRAAVDKVLLDLDLFEIKELKVGGPLNKYISGGQRKRLNIALELIREPSVLFVDEPTSGLSSMDSEMVMDLLKEQTLKGKLVIVNIHQPSSDIYKLFDQLLIMDKGGHPIYYGNPLDAVVYFKSMSNFANSEESECLTCGNVNPEQVLQIVEAKVVDEYGKLTRNRKISAKEWYKLYKTNIESKHQQKASTDALPNNLFKIPNKLKQYLIFTTRDVLSKFTNKQYILINFLEAPLLAFILGYFTKYIIGTAQDPNAYIFSENVNLPGYLFMCVVVSLFLGMTVSAEEIIRDRRILQREKFLNLSWVSYLNSKITIMFAISAIQTISFVLIGNYILELQGMNLSFFLILFTTAAFANVLGLNISAGLNSVVTIYILIPFILVPQLLLSGTIVKYDKLHKNIASEQFVPLVGDLMTSRWTYEALVVRQFKNNEFQKHFFDIDQKISFAAYRTTFIIPQLQSKVDICEKNIFMKQKSEETKKALLILKNEIDILHQDGASKFAKIDKLNINSINDSFLQEIRSYLETTKSYFSKIYNKANAEKDKKYEELIKELGGNKEALDKLKQDHNNNSLSDIVLNKQELNKIVEGEDRFIQIFEPIYRLPESNYGRAHFYSPVKIFFGKSIDTFWFNMIVIWIATLAMYILLCFDGLSKILTYFEHIKIKKTIKAKLNLTK